MSYQLLIGNQITCIMYLSICQHPKAFIRKGSFFLLLIAGSVLLFTQCGSGETPEEEETTTMEANEVTEKPASTSTVILITERRVLAQKHKEKAPAAEKKPEAYKEVKKDEIVRATTRKEKKHILFVPHRTTFTPVPALEAAKIEEVEPKAAYRLLSEVDAPPMYAYEACANKKHPEHCMHLRLQRYFSRNIDRSTFPEDGEDHVEYATFIVGTDGKVDPESITVVDQTPHCESCAEEARRLVEGLDDWKPGTYRGESVPVRVTLPVRFHQYEL